MAPETPKGPSSRLLTMKFMQRAANSGTSSPNTPESNEPSAKKTKTSHSPAEGRINPNFDQAAIQAALDDQEAQRQSALEEHAGNDAHWVLKKTFNRPAASKATEKPLNVVYVGYGDIDVPSDGDEKEDTVVAARTSTRKRKEPGDANGKDEASDDTSSEESSDEDGDSKRASRPATTDSASSSRNPSRSRSLSRPRKNPEAAKAKELRDKRKKKDVRLNKITSISSAGASNFGSSPSGKPMSCYNCQQPGHRASDCPKRGGSEGFYTHPSSLPINQLLGRHRITRCY